MNRAHMSAGDPLAVRAVDVAKYIREYLEREEKRMGYEASGGRRFQDGQNGRSQYSPAVELADAAGISESTLYKVKRGEKKWVAFGMADSIFTALGMPDWQDHVEVVPNPRWSQERIEAWRAANGGCADTEAGYQTEAGSKNGGGAHP